MAEAVSTAHWKSRKDKLTEDQLETVNAVLSKIYISRVVLMIYLHLEDIQVK